MTDAAAILQDLSAGDHTIAREVLQRGVAAIYAVAFVSAIAQFPALLGDHGLLPAPRFIARTSGRRLPSIYRLRPFRYSDRMLRGTALLGVLAAASVVVGLPQLGPPWVPLVTFALMWVLYLSIVSIGQRFYGFGWETLLLEAGAIVALLGSASQAPPLLIIVFCWWLVVRVEFGAGMIKMRGDSSWRDLTAMDYHHQTQPMPGPLSRLAHRMPRPVHRVETAGNHVIQLVMPLLLFAPQPIAGVAAVLIVLSQLWLLVTGNFAWLNWLTIVLAFSGISDSFLAWMAGAGPPVWSWFGVPLGGASPPEMIGVGPEPALPLWWAVLTTAAFLALAWLSWRPLLNLFSRHQLMNASFNRWHLVNAYGAFGSVTQLRREVEIEGTARDDPGPDDWVPYGFHGKPGDVFRVPRQFAPYHLRLDWLMWFLALGGVGRASMWNEEWFGALLAKLLHADAATLRLLRVDPFAGEAPRLIRVRIFAYRFTTRAEKRSTGDVWVREELAELVPPTGRAEL